MSSYYTTKRRQAVLRCLEQRPEEAFTANRLAEELRDSGCSVGLATVYRQLEKLEASGCIHKIHTEEGALYQYCPHPQPQHNCFLLRCQDCGHIVHLDCGHLEGLCRHLESVHQFCIDPRQTVLTGRCQNCRRKENLSDGIQ